MAQYDTLAARLRLAGTLARLEDTQHMMRRRLEHTRSGYRRRTAVASDVTIYFKGTDDEIDQRTVAFSRPRNIIRDGLISATYTKLKDKRLGINTAARQTLDYEREGCLLKSPDSFS